MSGLELTSHGELNRISQGGAVTYMFVQPEVLSPIQMTLAISAPEGEDPNMLIAKFRNAKMTVTLEFDEKDKEYETPLRN